MTATSASTAHRKQRDYAILGADTDLGTEQLECLETILDDHSRRAVSAAGIRPGIHCLEIGAGTGSMARWMADRVRPEGRVLAIDIDPERLSEAPGMKVRQHDINDGVPDGETFDLIHARLVLMHLRRRREIVADLIKALNPGGWLVLGEYLGPRFDPIAVPTPPDAALFRRVVSTVIEQIGEPGGISYSWANEVDAAFVDEGLTNVHSEHHLETTSGGCTGGILYGNYIRQAAPYLLRCGITAEEIERFCTIVLDPKLRTWLFEFVSVRGQKAG